MLAPLEMSAALYRHTAARGGARLDRVRLAPPESSPAEWIALARRERCEALIVDSLGKTSDPVRVLTELHDATNRGTVGLVVAIAHSTRDGDARGGPALEHEADTCIIIRPGNVAIVKDRFGPTGDVDLEWPPQ